VYVSFDMSRLALGYGEDGGRGRAAAVIGFNDEESAMIIDVIHDTAETLALSDAELGALGDPLDAESKQPTTAVCKGRYRHV
jgi:hypothetical protein